MKSFVKGALVMWFVFGVAGGWLSGRHNVGDFAGGPITFWHALMNPTQS
jgi:hypothetical protein